MKLVPGFSPEILKEKLTVTKIDSDISYFTDNQKKVISYLVKCAEVLGEVFLLQKYPDNLILREKINKKKDPMLLQYFNIMSGPFDHFNENKPYLDGIKKSDKAGFYPHDLTKSEWEQFLKKNSDKIEVFISPYHIIIRDEGKLKSVPYSEAYKEYLIKAAEILKEAMRFADNYSLKSYLSAQANAFLTNDFFEADIRWIQLSGNDIVPLLGAYEYYEDKFLGYKTSFTGLVGVKNRNEINKLSNIVKMLDILQSKLPIPEHYKKQKRGSISEIEVVNLLYNSGDSRGPIPTAAFNLPNSHKIRSDFGSKKVLLYNIMEAKYNSVLMPIAEMILTKKEQVKATFVTYFNYILMHEISHELGISFVKDSSGESKEVSFFLKDLYTVIEEAKADVMGIFLIIFLQKQGIITDCSYTDICIVYLINLIRAIRFGVENSHGLASLIQINFLIQEDVFMEGIDNKLSIDFHRFEKHLEKLLTIILTLQGEGDYGKTSNFIKSYSKMSKDVKKYLDLVNKLPIDIMPWYPKAAEKKPVLSNL